MFGTLAAWILDHPRRVTGGLLVALLVSAAGLAQLRIDFSFQSFVGSSDPAYQRLQDFTATWGSEDGVLLVLAELSDEGGDDFTQRRRLVQLEALLKALEASDAVKRTVGLPRIPRDAGLVGTLSFKPLLDLAGDTAEAAKRFRSDVLADPTLVPGLLSTDGRATLVLVELNINADDIIAFRPAVAAVRAVLAEHSQDGLTLLAAGIPAVRADLVQTIQTDQIFFGSLTALIMALLLIVLFRRLHGIVLCGLAAGLPTAMLHGVMGWEGEPVGILNQVYITLIPVIAVADAIHVLTRFHHEARSRSDGDRLDDDVRRAAIVAAYREVGTACLFTSITTAIGFVSLGLADMVALRNFGLHAALGILFAFGLLLFGGPLALRRVRRLPPMRRGSHSLERALERLAAVVLSRPWPIVVGSAVLIAALAWVGKDVVVDNRLSDTLGEGHATHDAGRVVDAKLAGQFSIHIDLAGPAGSLLEPGALRAADDLEQFARGLTHVRAVEGPGLIFRTLNRALTQQDQVPETRALAEQLLFLADASMADSPVLKPGGARGRVIVHVPDYGGNMMVALGNRLSAEGDRLFAGTGVTATVTGIPYVASRGFNRLSRELLTSLLTALLLIALVLGGLFRSLRVMLISLVPNLLPLLACVALLSALDWTLAPTVAVVFTVALGIAVDDTIHLLARLYEARAQNATADAMLTDAILHTGRPVLLTSAILTAGFAVNTLSSFPVLRHFGTLGSVAFVTAVVADLVVLPVLMQLFGGLTPRNPRPTPPEQVATPQAP